MSGLGPVHALPGHELEAQSLLDLQLRVWVEVGRARMPAASVVGMSDGAIVDLNREPEEPADLYVNGRHFGTGRLILVDGEWALRIESLDDDPELALGSEAEADGAIEQTSTFVQGDAQASD